MTNENEKTNLSLSAEEDDYSLDDLFVKRHPIEIAERDGVLNVRAADELVGRPS